MQQTGNISAPTIRAIVCATGKEVQVDDTPLQFGAFRCYNMWHNDTEGNVWHDDELEFLETRLQ